MDMWLRKKNCQKLLEYMQNHFCVEYIVLNLHDVMVVMVTGITFT